MTVGTAEELSRRPAEDDDLCHGCHRPRTFAPGDEADQ
jgi:hypothetical protein